MVCGIHFASRSIWKDKSSLATCWKRLGCALERLGSVLKRLGGGLERLGAVLTRLGSILDACWKLEVSWMLWGQFWNSKIENKPILRERYRSDSFGSTKPVSVQCLKAPDSLALCFPNMLQKKRPKKLHQNQAISLKGFVVYKNLW